MLRVGRWEETSLREKMIQPIAVDHGYLERLPVAVDIHGQRRMLASIGSFFPLRSVLPSTVLQICQKPRIRRCARHFAVW